MSNYLSIAAVTATIARLVGAALAQIPAPSGTPGIRYVMSERDPAFVGCTIVLYHVHTNPFQRNAGLPARGDRGIPVEKPRATLDADYLLAFSGNEATLEPQRFLGAVVAALTAQPFLTPDAIRQTVDETPSLSGLDSNQVAPIRLVQRDLDDETLSRVWALFPGMPYHVSLFYRASPITIEAQIVAVEIPKVAEVATTIEVQ